jgi:hypothetical protein
MLQSGYGKITGIEEFSQLCGDQFRGAEQLYYFVLQSDF